jgi:RimJ/RimL family protein N-acetyltransferase
MWRNDPQIWTYTGFKATGYITPEIETEWLRNSLNKPDQIRFAICVRELDAYIGNVQLCNIQDKSAEFHVFIGNKVYWGKSIGYQAIKLILKYAFFERDLESVYLRVNPANIRALSLYEKAGFEITGKDDRLIRMTISRKKFTEMEYSKEYSQQQ